MNGKINIVFRTDASSIIGTGHIMRCLCLADELHKRGANIVFICRPEKGNLIEFIEQRGYQAIAIDQHSSGEEKAGDFDWQEDARQSIQFLEQNSLQPDWLIVDHYRLDYKWEKAIQAFSSRIMVIDDLANRHHDADLLLDQNFYQDMQDRYKGLIPSGANSLLGPSYALLRPEFLEERQRLKKRDGKVKRILLCFGGSDSSTEILKVLKALKLMSLPENIRLDVIAGINSSQKDEIARQLAVFPQGHFYSWVNNMAELMANADLYIGAAGTSCWERSCLGLPSIVIALAENQIKACMDMDKEGLHMYLGPALAVDQEQIKSAINRCLAEPALLEDYAKASLELVDGLGAQRCADILIPC